MIPEQIKALVERSGVKMPKAAIKVLGAPLGFSRGGYTAEQLHAVIAEMQEKLEVALQDNTCIEDMRNEIVFLKKKLEAAEKDAARYLVQRDDAKFALQRLKDQIQGDCI